MLCAPVGGIMGWGIPLIGVNPYIGSRPYAMLCAPVGGICPERAIYLRIGPWPYLNGFPVLYHAPVRGS